MVVYQVLIGVNKLRMVYEDGVELHKVHKQEQKFNTDTNKHCGVECLVKDVVTCLDEDVVAYLDEGVVAFLDNNNKDKFLCGYNTQL